MPTGSKHSLSLDDSNRPIKHAKSGEGSALAGFWHLPEELRSSILDLACRALPFAPSSYPSRGIVEDLQSPSSSSWRSRHERISLDVLTTSRLALVCRNFHTNFNPLLYAHVKLYRPTELVSFYQSVKLRPSNGQLVRSLHIGPHGEVPRSSYWPLQFGYLNAEDKKWYREQINAVRTSLIDRQLLPSWCPPGRAFTTRVERAQDCRARCVARALTTTLEAVGLDIDKHFFYPTPTRPQMDVAERCVRVYQLEEALNLYLIEMARVDRMKGYEMEESHQKSTAVDSPVTCSDSECRHYPRLVVTESEQREVASSEEKRGPESATKDSDGENDDEEVKPLILTLAQLDRPLRRRGESGDHFDHPVFYARTGLMRLAIDEFGAVYVDHGSERFAEMYGGEEIGEPCADENCPMLHDTEPDDWDYGIPSNEVTFMHGVQKPPPLSGLKAASNEPDPAIFPGLLAICRNVLMATSQLVNLSLTGFLARPLYSNAPPLTTLRFLCIGPSSASYRDMPDLASNSVPNLEKLRLCGMRMEYYMERRIAGHLGAFLRLREFHCDSGITYADHDLIYSHVLKMVDVLQGRLTHLGAGSDEEEATASAERLSDAEPTSTAQDPTTVTQRYIELRLGRRMLDRLLTSAHTPEIRAAWRTGSEVSDAPHRLRLRKSRAARRGWESHEKSQAHQRDSDTWWDDRALECEVEAHKS